MVLQIERRWTTALSVNLSSPAQVPAGSVQYSKVLCSVLLGPSLQLHPQKCGAPAHSADSGTDKVRVWPWTPSSIPCNVQAPYFAPSAQKSQIFMSGVAKWGVREGRVIEHQSTEQKLCIFYSLFWCIYFIDY